MKRQGPIGILTLFYSINPHTRLVVAGKNRNFAYMSSTVFLIGYMGSGKTTLGEAVATATGCSFMDLDDYIERTAGMTIREIFDTKGEPAFREMEREAMLTLADSGIDLVACGGGTPCHGDNMELLNRYGLTVYLKAPHSSLLSRLKEGRAKRPLIARLSDGELSDFITAQLTAREPYYSQACVSFDSSRLESVPQVEESVKEFLEVVSHHIPDFPKPQKP